MRGDDSYGKPLDCVGIPLQAQVGKHDFIKLTPMEAKSKGLLMEDGEEPKAHLSQKFVYPHDWTRTKHDVCVPMYTELESGLLLSFRQVRDLLVQNIDDARKLTEHTSDIQNALVIIDSILGFHEVHSEE